MFVVRSLRRAPRRRRALLAGCLLLAAANTDATAQQVRYDRVNRQEPAESALATPTSRFPAGWLHRLLLGDHHRDLWSLPVRAPVLDLQNFAGGLTFERLGGGGQTQSMRFRGRDGREYAFRSIDKDAARTLDPELRRSIAATVLQDQVSGLLPMSALVVAPLLDAAGVLHAEPQLVVMPDDPRLGEHRAVFAGMLGFIEERPNEGPDGEPGFAGATAVVGSEEFFDKLEDDPRNRLDVRAFIRARLLDAFVGDWDRHPDQWRWAGFNEGDSVRWEPVPRDRDWALARLDGVLVWAAGFAFPNYVGFSGEYPSAFRQTWAGRALDRRLLVAAPESLWIQEATRLTQRLTDSVLHHAVRQLPPAYYDRLGATLTAQLAARRDGLVDFARDFYRLLAGWADVHTTDAAEHAVLERRDDGTVRVRVEAPGRTVFDRTFHPDETREVRLWLQGGPDRAEVTGASDDRIVLRVLGGGNADTLIDRTRGDGVRFYDDRGDNSFVPGERTTVDRSSWAPRLAGGSDTQQAPARDWGAFWLPYPILSVDPDRGVVAGMGAIRYGYGFRHYPWKTRLAISLGFGSAAMRPEIAVSYDAPAGPARMRLHGRYSGIERDNFFGFGNETPHDQDRDFYRTNRQYLALEAHAGARGGHVEAFAGPAFLAVRHRESATILDTLALYGEGEFEQAGVTAALAFDTRRTRPVASRGVNLRLDARFFPALLDVESPFGSVRAEGTVLLGADTTAASVVLALRAGGMKVWGRAPFHEVAYVGGPGTIRGLASERFAGHAAAFANAELRFPLLTHYLLLPGHIGAFALADVGRVFAHGDDSGRWHPAYGGGLWISALAPSNVLSLSFARSREQLGVNFRAGFMF